MSYNNEVNLNPDGAISKSKEKEPAVEKTTSSTSSIFGSIDATTNTSKSPTEPLLSVFENLGVTNSAKELNLEAESPLPNIDYDNFTDTLKSYYNDSGKDANKTYEYLKSTIVNNKNNPDNIKKIVDSILLAGGLKSDPNGLPLPIANNNAQILEGFLEDGFVPNALCPTIHGVMMETLNDCGIPAVLDGGKDIKKNDSHIVLIYQIAKGKYICNNYNNNIEIEADNIVDASKLAHKQSPNYTSNGSIILAGNNGQYYQEYEFPDETAFGKEIDKSNSDSKSMFNTDGQSPISIGIKAEITPSSQTYRAGINNIKGLTEDDYRKNGYNPSENIDHTKSMELEYKKSGNTNSFDKSESIGAKLTSYDEYGDLRISGKFILSTVMDESNVNNIFEITEKSTHQVVGEDLGISYIPEIYNNGGNLTISAGIKAFETGRNNMDWETPSSDTRGTLEVGAQANYKSDNLSFKANVSGGGIADLAMTDYKTQNYGLHLGYKTNLETSFNYKPNEQVELSASANGFYSKTPALQHYGAAGNVEVKITPENSNKKFFAGISDEYYKKHLDIGLFSEDIAFANTLKAYVGVNLLKGLEISGGYSQDTNKEPFKDGKASLSLIRRY